ncbi:hypothetical protein ACFL27_01840 [candidate division CSSED10-310 bacterium]|uniref:Uncharacterized protein n=1 Tax=candidate division CSSED10-310 bacterium TaxID=2855610 RepID=A0ABV6YRV7_UNCC1
MTEKNNRPRKGGMREDYTGKIEKPKDNRQTGTPSKKKTAPPSKKKTVPPSQKAAAFKDEMSKIIQEAEQKRYDEKGSKTKKRDSIATRYLNFREILIIMAVLAACIILVHWIVLMLTTSEETEKEWYEGGTLHLASVQEWLAATYGNRVATAADFVKNSSDTKMNMALFTSRAVSLERCITDAAEKTNPTHTIVDLSSMCLIKLGF